ncbi:hypothetical protein EYF80_001374 [Liparis tanakae]|uniref:Uncharacterized protein n=1 Tax=Liparis tanakae TaxID=230148 RepID=A0A4Z2JEZ6_9TELE|nr:hypothetical protein EYF80_001374 [Liparis tanakae]
MKSALAVPPTLRNEGYKGESEIQKPREEKAEKSLHQEAFHRRVLKVHYEMMIITGEGNDTEWFPGGVARCASIPSSPPLTEPDAGHKQWLPPLHGLTGNYWEAEKERAEGVGTSGRSRRATGNYSARVAARRVRRGGQAPPAAPPRGATERRPLDGARSGSISAVAWAVPLHLLAASLPPVI